MARALEDVRCWSRAWLARRLDVPVESIDDQRPVVNYGMSSLDAVEFSGDLSAWLGRPLPATLCWDHPTLDAIARATVDQAGLEDPAAPTRTTGPLALAGLAVRVPGASDPDSLWNLLEEGRDAITAVPETRWDADTYHDPDPLAPGKMVTRYGGFLDDIESFDAAFFGLTPREVRVMDPQQRLLMEVTWEALQDAGLGAGPGPSTGVFVGISHSDHGGRVLSSTSLTDAYAGTGNALSIAANRLSYWLDLRGPSLAIDTACSSSLVALHLARRSLLAGECERALVAGVNLILDPMVTVNFSKAGFMAADGRCRAFGAGASGYVRSEGVVVVVLETPEAARARRGPTRALLLGTAMNQDGRSNGLTAPSRRAQSQVIRAACADAGVPVASLGYVEAHGTGTPLGDPIEALALADVLGEGRATDRPCLIGSVKSNLGHLEAAAGLAGLAKVVLCLEHGRIVPSLHAEQPNPHIPFDDLPVRVATRVSPWPAGPRLAGVSAFGFGGTNAHAILGAAPEVAVRPPRTEPGPVQRQRYPLVLAPGQHPVLGWPVGADGVGDRHWRFSVSLVSWPALGDHRVAGRVLWPAAASLAVIRLAARRHWPGQSVVLENCLFPGALEVDGVPWSLDLTLESRHREGSSPGAAGEAPLFGQLTARRGEHRLVVCRCEVRPGGDVLDDLAGQPPRALEPEPDIYPRLRELGLDYGPHFRRIATTVVGDTDVQGTFAAARPGETDGPWEGLPPWDLDGSFHPLVALPDQDPALAIPVRLDRITFSPSTAACGHTRVSSREPRVADVVGETATGTIVFRAEGLRLSSRSEGDAVVQVAAADGDRLGAVVPAQAAPLAPLETRSVAGASSAVGRDPTPGPVPLREALRDQLARLLGLEVEKVDRQSRLSQLGLDSLVSLELTEWVEATLGRPLPGDLLASDPTLDELADLLDPQAAVPATGTSPVESLEADLWLPPEVRRPHGPAAPFPWQTAVLTGATGYLGAHLLARLLLGTRARILALVRASSPGVGLQRLRDALRRHDLIEAAGLAEPDRVEVLCADLGANELGLTADDQTRISAQADVIIHAGAWVHFGHGYAALRAANVDATRTLLGLSCRTRLVPLHVVSTLGMLLSTAHDAGTRLDETTETLPHEGLSNGYEKSKWVADRLAVQARLRGLPVSVHRVGLLVGHSRTGHYDKPDDFFAAWLTTCVEMGLMPRLTTLTQLIPVDVAANAIIALALSHRGAGLTHHVTHPLPRPMDELAETIAAGGWPMQLVPYAAWKERALAGAQSDPSHPLHRLQGFLGALDESQSVFPTLDSTLTWNRLGPASVSCPDMALVVGRTLGWLAAQGRIRDAVTAKSPTP